MSGPAEGFGLSHRLMQTHHGAKWRERRSWCFRYHENCVYNNLRHLGSSSCLHYSANGFHNRWFWEGDIVKSGRIFEKCRMCRNLTKDCRTIKESLEIIFDLLELNYNFKISDFTCAYCTNSSIWILIDTILETLWINQLTVSVSETT